MVQVCQLSTVPPSTSMALPFPPVLALLEPPLDLSGSFTTLMQLLKEFGDDDEQQRRRRLLTQPATCNANTTPVRLTEQGSVNLMIPHFGKTFFFWI